MNHQPYTQNDVPLLIDNAILQGKDTYALFKTFHGIAENHQGNPYHEEFFGLLATCMLLRWFPKDREAFGSLEQLNNWRILKNGQLSDAQANQLRWVANHTTAPVLRARLGDILWVFKKDHQQGNAAVNAYLQVAKQAEENEKWFMVVDSLARAMTFSMTLGKNRPQTDEVQRHIERVINRHQNHAISTFPKELIEILLSQKKGDLAVMAHITEQLAVREDLDGKTLLAEQLWLVNARCHQQLKDREAVIKAQKAAAEAWVTKAERALEDDSFQRGTIAHWLKRSLLQLRNLPDTEQRVAELHHKLLTVQQQAVRELQPIDLFPEDVETYFADLAKETAKVVDPDDFLLSLLRFAALFPSPSLNELKANAVKENGFIADKLFPPEQLSSTGQTLVSPTQDPEELMWMNIYQSMRLYQASCAQAIESGRQAFLEAFHLKPEHLVPVIDNNPFIPSGHHHLVFKALYEGFQGDMLSSIHLLVPQLEAMLRHLIQQYGGITTTLTTTGIQQEVSLNQLLEDDTYREKLTKFLHEDTVYDLRGLLIEKHGSNLRNNLAHGLLPLTDFYDASVIYSWYRALSMNLIRFC